MNLRKSKDVLGSGEGHTGLRRVKRGRWGHSAAEHEARNGRQVEGIGRWSPLAVDVSTSNENSGFLLRVAKLRIGRRRQVRLVDVESIPD